MQQATVDWKKIALKWRALAERRQAYYIDLYNSGRWARYYTAEEFRIELRDTIALVQRWDEIAPVPEEQDQVDGVERQIAA